MTMAKIEYMKKLIEKTLLYYPQKIIIILFRTQDCLPRGIYNDLLEI